MSSDASRRHLPEGGGHAPCDHLKLVCLSVYPPDGPSLRHRILAYAGIWRSTGVALTVQPFLTRGLYRNRRRFGLWWTLYKALQFAFCTVRLTARVLLLRRFDLVIIHREAFPLGGAWFERLAARVNRHIVFDVDDAIWLPMPLSVNQRKLFWDRNRVADAMSACAAVVVGNDYLGAYASRHNASVHVIPTPYLDLGGSANATSRPGRSPVVVWIGNVGNEEYLRLVRTPLQRLACEFDFVFRVIGSAEAAGFSIPGVKVEALEWREDREREWLLDSSIGIMPLHDREYERGKCSFKLVQYFSAGLPVVASPVGMNVDVVVDGFNGCLATDEDQWYASLKLLLDSEAERRRMGANGYATYRARFTRGGNAELWREVFARVRAATP